MQFFNKVFSPFETRNKINKITISLRKCLYRIPFVENQRKLEQQVEIVVWTVANDNQEWIF